MALFTITAQNFVTQDKKTIIYDTSISSLKWEDGSYIVNPLKESSEVKIPAKINKGKRNLKTIKIQLGLSCNFECEYCSQRFIPRAEETNPEYVDNFVNNMDSWYKGAGDMHFEFWGGEPFVYWKTFKPLAEKLKLKYPNSTMSVITNGSLLDKEKNDWLEALEFSMSISHDGPGQFVRGPDPFDDPKSKEGILDIFKRFAPKGKISFNPMINSKNISRAAINDWFMELIKTELGEEYLQHIHFGEGGFVDAYDEGGLENSLLDGEKDIEYRNIAAEELRSGKANRFHTFTVKSMNFIESLQNQVRIESLGQKCGMDKDDNIAVDLHGNVMTCQNVSTVSNNPAGISHHIGHVSNLEAVEVKTATHWSDRKECSDCPVLHLCKGACMFLSGDLWEASCNNAYSDNVIILCNIIEGLTGYFPVYIDGPLREDRKDLFWIINGKPDKLRKPKKVIPIMQG
jgi:uncharacterized protein